MVHAFIMVKTAAGRSGAIRDAALDLEAVTEGHVVAGEFDVLAEVDAAEVHDVLRTASSSIQGLDGVEDTKTYISMSS